MFFDRAVKSIVGKPLMTLIHRKYPDFTSALNLTQIGSSNVGLPIEISRLMTQKYRLVVSISTKSFKPASTELSFQVSRVDETFKPEVAPLGSGGAAHSSGASSSTEGSGTAMSILDSFPGESSTLQVLPLDEMNTPISAFKGKRQAVMPKTPSKSPCPTKARRKLFTKPSKPKDTGLSTSAAKVAAQDEGIDPAVKVALQAEEVTPIENVVQSASESKVRAFLFYTSHFSFTIIPNGSKLNMLKRKLMLQLLKIQ